MVEEAKPENSNNALNLSFTFEGIVMKLSISLVLYTIDMIPPCMWGVGKGSVTILAVIPFSHRAKPKLSFAKNIELRNPKITSWGRHVA